MCGLKVQVLRVEHDGDRVKLLLEKHKLAGEDKSSGPLPQCVILLIHLYC